MMTATDIVSSENMHVPNKTNRKYTTEFRERAVLMVSEVRKDEPSLWTAINAVSGKLGCSAHSLLAWVKKAGVQNR